MCVRPAWLKGCCTPRSIVPLSFVPQGVEQYTQYFDESTNKTRRLSWQVRAVLPACLPTSCLD